MYRFLCRGIGRRRNQGQRFSFKRQDNSLITTHEVVLALLLTHVNKPLINTGAIGRYINFVYYYICISNSKNCCTWNVFKHTHILLSSSTIFLELSRLICLPARLSACIHAYTYRIECGFPNTFYHLGWHSFLTQKSAFSISIVLTQFLAELNTKKCILYRYLPVCLWYTKVTKYTNYE